MWVEKEKSALTVWEYVASNIGARLLMKSSIGKYIVVIMAEANCLSTGKKASWYAIKTGQYF